MKLGFLTAILEDDSFTETIDCAQRLGYRSVELAAWPQGEGGRRYAGTSHVDAANMNAERAAELLEYAAAHDVEIHALGYYPNPMDPDPETQASAISHIKAVINAAAIMGVPRVSTFIGKDKRKSEQENLRLFAKLWPSIIEYAEQRKVQVGIENCPMYFSQDEWPGGLNLASSPHIWRRIFEIIPSPYFGLSYDPSHLHLQGMDYLKPLYEFTSRIFHIHLKDIAVDQARLDEFGIFTPPLNYMDPRIPGRGGIDWKAFMKALKEIKYDACACVEIEDRDYEADRASVERALAESIHHISAVME